LIHALWLVSGAVAFHELEEWNVAAWSARNFTNHTEVSNEAMWIGLVMITVIFVGWIAAATRLQNPITIGLLALPAVGLVALGNAVQHVTWTFLFAEYSPGVASAVLLVVPASCFALWRILSLHRLFAIPVLLCAGLWVAAAVQIVQAGRVLQPFQVILQQLCISMATALGLPGTMGA
jgi:hypothetical protein